MFVCMDCGHLFEKPNKIYETHGLDTPPYETRYVCPSCYSDYFHKTEKCDGCGEYIVYNYVETLNGERYCENCYNIKDVGDLD